MKRFVLIVLTTALVSVVGASVVSACGGSSFPCNMSIGIPVKLAK